MKINVLIVGAGSIGNHLAYSCRKKNWNVSIFDIDKSALKRTKNIIYPSRYKIWDDEIILLSKVPHTKNFDLVIIGTPPDTHIEVCRNIISILNPKIILIEKPLCRPDLNGLKELQSELIKTNTKILVGYNHNLTENTKYVEKLITKDTIGNPLSLHVRWLEFWGGIFEAHPWLEGPQDSYLGYSDRGGGACAEHSHAISIWQHFSNFLNCGKISEVTSTMNIFKNNNLLYDETTILSLKSENGLTGSVIQDVITEPSQKNLRIQGSNGFIEWHVNYKQGYDAVIYGKKNSKPKTKLFSKTRPNDFEGEINHIEKIIKNPSLSSPISIDLAINCMKVIKMAFESNIYGEKMKIN